MKIITRIQLGLSTKPTLGNLFVHIEILVRDGTFTLSGTPFQKDLDQNHMLKMAPYPTSPNTINVKGFRMG